MKKEENDTSKFVEYNDILAINYVDDIPFYLCNYLATCHWPRNIQYSAKHAHCTDCTSYEHIDFCWMCVLFHFHGNLFYRPVCLVPTVA